MIDINKFQEFVATIIHQYDEKITPEFVKEFMFSLDTKELFSIPIEKLIEWNIFTNKGHAKRKLFKCFVENVDFINKGYKSFEHSGRPIELIMLNVECFKSMCILTTTKQAQEIRKYYIVLEKMFKQYMETEYVRINNELYKTQEQLVDTKEQLYTEQTNNIDLKKCIQQHFIKNHTRHKFRDIPCVYILHNPDDIYSRYKIGMSKDINERLRSDRTMIPTIKVRYIMYTDYYETFEKCIKARFRDKLELPSHEWVFEELDKLIDAYNEIDKVCGFHSIVDTELWRYNLEEPNSNIECKEIIENNIIYNPDLVLNKRIKPLLPKFLIKNDLIIKNEKAPNNKKYCNGWCQDYVLISEFALCNTYTTEICKKCINMEEIAQIKLHNKELTINQIKNNPRLITINNYEERICSVCNIVKHLSNFERNRRKCNDCRHIEAKEYNDKFEDNVVSQVSELRQLPLIERNLKIQGLVKDNLLKLIKYLKTGRKSSDTKKIMVNRVIKYFIDEENNNK